MRALDLMKTFLFRQQALVSKCIEFITNELKTPEYEGISPSDLLGQIVNQMLPEQKSLGDKLRQESPLRLNPVHTS